MARFVYKMENILGIKYKMEEQAKTSYGNARAKLTLEEEKLNDLHIKKEMYQNKLTNLMSSNLKVMDIKQSEDAIEITKLFIKQQLIAVKKAEQLLEAARLRLNAAMLERKTHEKLKDRALENYMLEYEAQQRKEIDELVSFKYNNSTDNQ
jgi:flagellar FliJ protein